MVSPKIATNSCYDTATVSYNLLEPNDLINCMNVSKEERNSVLKVS